MMDADARGGEEGLGLLGDRTRVAAIGLAGTGLVDVAEQDQRGLRGEVECVEALDLRKARQANAAFDIAPLAIDAIEVAMSFAPFVAWCTVCAIAVTLAFCCSTAAVRRTR